MFSVESAAPFAPGDGRSEEELRPLSEFAVPAVDRTAACFQDYGRSQDNLFDYAFWELMYGPYMDDDDGAPTRGLFEPDYPDLD